MSELQLIDPATWPTDTIPVPIDEIPYDDVMAWSVYAVCAQADPEAWFPEKGGSTNEAKRLCFTCEVRPQCLEYALANDERFGVWGGLSERERRKERHKRAKAAAEPAAAPEPVAAQTAA